MLLLRSNESHASLELPKVILVPAILVAAMFLQSLLGRIFFYQSGLLYSAYLLWASLLMILGRYCAKEIGIARLADVLALAIAVGASISAATTFAQWLGFAPHVSWMASFPGGAIVANLGQPNHHAHYSWLGIASIFYLYGQGRFSQGMLWLLTVFIGSGTLLSGSRSVFLYPLVILAALAWAHYREPQSSADKLWSDASLLLPVLIGLSYFGTWVTPHAREFWSWFGGPSIANVDFISTNPGGSSMSGARLFDLVSGPSVRIALGRAAWDAFVEQPWIGQGVGNYSWGTFVAASRQSGGEQLMVGVHAHNFVLQFLAEFGAPVAVAVILMLAFWAKQFLQQRWRLEHIWCASILGIGAVHSLLEYPLWYSYFLGPTALLLGATDVRKPIIVEGRRAAIYLVFVALAGISILVNLRADYSKMEAASNYPLAAHVDREQAWRISMDRLLKLHRESLLSPWVLLAFNILAEPNKRLAQDRADLCTRGIHFSPARSLVARCAMHLAIAGRDEEAKKLAVMVLRAYPAQSKLTMDEFAKEAEQYPEIKPLLRFGSQK
ncbi:MAG: Wzy polymerase domain-containing protein [Sulfuritalea sp.]|nr:Wzy polymerase domain-containing protein [Sulfuritalea sp.]